MKPVAALGAVLIASTVLVGCGSATVDNSATASHAPTSLPRGSQLSSSTAASAATRPEPAPAAPQPGSRDQGAHEISAVPSPDIDAAEAQYLESLETAGIEVDGVRDQVVGVAAAVCSGEDVTADAVAGQLVAQQRTDMSHEEVLEVLRTQAQEVYCPA